MDNAKKNGGNTADNDTRLLESQLAAAQLSMEKYPSQTANVVLSLIMAAIGVIFIWMFDRRDLGSIIMIIGGLAFILPGAGSLLTILVQRKSKTTGSVMNFITGICAVAAIALGVVILVSPGIFRHLLVYLFGALLILAAAWQFDVMMRKNRGVLFPGWLIIGPVIIVALGVVMCSLDIFKTEVNERWMLLATGIGFTIFGIVGLLISYYAFKTHHAIRKLATAATKAATTHDKPSDKETETDTENSSDTPTTDKKSAETTDKKSTDSPSSFI